MKHDATIINYSPRQDSRCFVRDKVQEAIEAAGVTGNALLVLYAFSRRMTNDPEAVVHLAAEELRKRTGLSLRSITRTLRELERSHALVLRSKAGPGKAAGYAFGPAILEPYKREVAAVEERKAARAAQATSATLADVAPNASQIRSGHRPPWPATSTDLREKNNDGVLAMRKEEKRALPVSSQQRDAGATVMPFGKHRNKPLREIDLSYLDWALKDTDEVKKRPALKADIEAWIQRRAEQKARAEERVPGAEATGRYLAELRARKTA
jgi:hypothetical protein